MTPDNNKTSEKMKSVKAACDRASSGPKKVASSKELMKTIEGFRPLI